MNAFTLDTEFASVTWALNSVNQGSVTVNNDNFTTLSSTLFDTDFITLQVPNQYGGGNFADFIVNGQSQNSISNSITIQVGNELEIEVNYF
jgi:hypothetical protein